MNGKKRILILLKFLDQIKQDNEEASSGIERSVSQFAKKRVFLLNMYFIFCFFDAAVVTNHPLAFRVKNLF